ncbi:hypothetical protein K8R66_00935, partial [bacterium]|nr:hypothetical protein [bacterium]
QLSESLYKREVVRTAQKLRTELSNWHIIDGPIKWKLLLEMIAKQGKCNFTLKLNVFGISYVVSAEAMLVGPTTPCQENENWHVLLFFDGNDLDYFSNGVIWFQYNTRTKKGSYESPPYKDLAE